MEDTMSEVGKYVKTIDDVLKTKDEVREYLIRAVREITRDSGLAITYIHLNNVSEAEGILLNLKRKIDEVENRLNPHPELKYSNLYLTALTEYVEAAQFISLVRFGKLKAPEELGMHYIPYLQGMLDLIGEIKRYSLELVASGMIEDAWKYFNIANEIYEAIKTLDYPEPLIPGVRHKIDVSRKVLEDLREFLIDMELRLKLISTVSKSLNPEVPKG
ncbi:MAG: hypothetical protein QXZ63_03025 [Sulfolobales archaeon]